MNNKQLRDNLCDQNYLIEEIAFTNETITEKKAKIKSLESDISNGIKRFPKENIEIIDTTYFGLFILNFNNIRAHYSCGNNPSVLEKYLIDGIDSIENTNKNAGYLQILWMVSLGILLEVESEIFIRISKLVKRGKYKDALLDFLLKSCNVGWSENNTVYEEANPYAKTAEIIELAIYDKEAASKRLEKYMNEEWFKGHYSYEWKNAHKRHGYFGFWSFESAAIAKILDLNDDVLKDNNHYPYDLRYFK